MKKLLSILLFIMFIPFVVNAKEYCTIVSGNGKDIGSEIACGTEHFYVIENDNNEIKMLAKYNLYVGRNYDKIVLDISNTYIKAKCIEEYNCFYQNDGSKFYFDGEEVSNFDVWTAKLEEKYNLHNYFSQDIGEYYLIEDNNRYMIFTYKIYPYTIIDINTDGYALQNSKALGVTGEKGNANYPINATTDLFESSGSTYIYNFDIFQNGYTNFEFRDDSFIKKYLDDYSSNLNNMGYDMLKVDMLNIKEINNLIYAINGNTLPLTQWYTLSLDSSITEEELLSKYKQLGDLKKYVSDNYNWIWNTTYWTKTKVSSSAYDVYFISSSGEICYSDTCYNGIPRAGIRPVVTMSKSNIKYNIKTKTDDNGTVEVVDSAVGGEKISFRVSAKEGLKLVVLTITTDSGEKVEFTEEDITSDSSGVLSVITNKFTMPYENVTIEARWISSTINPNTGTGISMIIIATLLLVNSITYIMIKRKKNYILK